MINAKTSRGQQRRKQLLPTTTTTRTYIIAADKSRVGQKTKAIVHPEVYIALITALLLASEGEKRAGAHNTP